MCAAKVVADAGFSSVEAANADEAFAILENRSDIALLFTDIQMPCKQASKIAPSIIWYINGLARQSASEPHAD